MRRRYNSLDSGAPSTSGRGTFPSYPSSNPSRPLNQFGYDDSWDLTDDGGYTPFPVNLPTGEAAEGHGMEMGQMSAGLHLSDSKEIWGKMGQVMCLLSDIQIVVGAFQSRTLALATYQMHLGILMRLTWCCAESLEWHVGVH